jgi:multidrug resistance efflux pump
MIENYHTGQENDIRDDPTRSLRNSEEVEEIMSKMPNRLIRYGISVMFLIFCGIFAGAFFITYPEIIVSDITISHTLPPVEIISPSQGRIQSLFVENNQLVGAGDPIGLLENTASLPDVNYIKDLVVKIDSTLQESSLLPPVNINKAFSLGDVQPEFATFYLAFHQYKFFIEQGLAMQIIGNLQKRLALTDEKAKELLKKEMFLREQLELESKKFQQDSLLKAGGLSTELEFYNSQLSLLLQQIATNTSNFEKIENTLQESQFAGEIASHQLLYLEKKHELRFRLHEAIRRLLGQIAQWEHNYLIESPIDGKIVLFHLWTKNQFVKQSELISIVIPEDQSYLCKGFLPAAGAGKVQPGQKVLIKLAAFPSEEFGTIEGRVSGISEIPYNNAYSVQVELVNGLTTSLNKAIPSYSLQEGKGEILTNNKSLIRQLFERVLMLRDYN